MHNAPIPMMQVRIGTPLRSCLLQIFAWLSINQVTYAQGYLKAYLAPEFETIFMFALRGSAHISCRRSALAHTVLNTTSRTQSSGGRNQGIDVSGW